MRWVQTRKKSHYYYSPPVSPMRSVLHLTFTLFKRRNRENSDEKKEKQEKKKRRKRSCSISQKS